MVVRAGVGPIKATFAMNVQFHELDQPNHAAVLARGQAPGSAVEMVSAMNLSELDPSRTVMEWTSDVSVSGMIAQVGARLMQGAADKITQQLFACIKAKLEGQRVAT
jgi:carbon monoxide dehydrogenase subunit G